MFKRLFWLAVGVGLGFGLSVWAARAMRRTAERYTPESVAGRLADALRELGKGLGEAVREGREAMAEREAELRSEIESRTAPFSQTPARLSGPVPRSEGRSGPAMGQGADPTRN